MDFKKVIQSSIIAVAIFTTAIGVALSMDVGVLSISPAIINPTFTPPITEGVTSVSGNTDALGNIACSTTNPTSAASMTCSLLQANGIPVVEVVAGSISGVPAGTIQATKTDTTQASGTNYFLSLLPTYNQTASAASNWDIFLNRAASSVGSGTQYLVMLQQGGVEKFAVQAGVTAGLIETTVGLSSPNPNGALNIGGYHSWSLTSGATVTIAPSTSITTASGSTTGVAISPSFAPAASSSGTYTTVAVTPTYNQTTGTQANTDLQITRTETAVGSGNQLLVAAGTTAAGNLFTVDNKGHFGEVTAAGVNVPTVPSGTCATGNGSITGNDQSGKLTLGATATSSCLVQFYATWKTAPVACLTAPAAAADLAAVGDMAYVSALSASSFTISGTTLANTVWYYHCY